MTPTETRAQKRIIKPLPKGVINKIAAGEVVERPAAVVKELVENSLDAGAHRVEVHIEGGGTRLIRVIDDGCGIDEAQIEIAFARHATSKIAAFTDLDSLSSYGFRGEALPSIASVSRLRMVSRAIGAGTGTELRIEGGVVVSKKPCAASGGTLIEIEQLFYNTPARLKFLKSEAAESRLIARAMTALALGTPQVGFTFTANGKPVFSFPPGVPLRERTMQLLGDSTPGIDLHHSSPLLSVDGYLGHPDRAVTNRYGHYLFVNQRWVQLPLLTHAVTFGFRELLLPGRYPVGALHLCVPPESIDVNVHPAKTEIRFAQEREVHDELYHAVKQAVRSAGFAVGTRSPAQSTDQSREIPPGSAPLPRQGTLTFRSGIGESATAPRPSENAFARMTPRQAVEMYRPADHVANADRDTTSPQAQPAEDSRPTEYQPGEIGTRFIGQFDLLYLLFQRGGELILVDQHAAHERIRYEEVLRAMGGEGAHGQTLLFPVVTELSPERDAILQIAREPLRKLGFALAPFGGRSVAIEALPVWFSSQGPDKALADILDELADYRSGGEEYVKKLAQVVACRSSIMAGDQVSPAEADALWRRLNSCEQPAACPHGRPTMLLWSRPDLDRRFGRI